MKVEIKDARVELEVVGGKATLYVNGQSVQVSRDVGVSLIFGDSVRYIPQPTTPAPKPGLSKATPRRSGPQSPAARKKLSESLKAYHAKKRQQKVHRGKGKSNGKSHLNGASIHIN